MLQLVPVLSMLFLMTTAAGSALWVVKLEEQRGLRERHENGGRTEGHYVDDPL